MEENPLDGLTDLTLDRNEKPEARFRQRLRSGLEEKSR
jgi:hypothetical protein